MQCLDRHLIPQSSRYALLDKRADLSSNLSQFIMACKPPSQPAAIVSSNPGITCDATRPPPLDAANTILVTVFVLMARRIGNIVPAASSLPPAASEATETGDCRAGNQTRAAQPGIERSSGQEHGTHRRREDKRAAEAERPAHLDCFRCFLP